MIISHLDTRMKNPQTVVIAVVVVLLALGGFLYIKQGKTMPMMQGGSGNEISDGSTIDSMKGTLQDLFAKNVPMECTFTSVTEGVQSSGTVMVSGKKVRGEFIAIVAGKETSTSMIQDGEYAYMWSADQTMGTKIKIDPAAQEAAKEAAAANNQQAFDMASQQAEYSCKPWVPNPGAFTPPTNIKFTDLSAMMEDSKKMMEGTQKAPCSVCNQIPAGAERNECLARLNCN